MPEESPRYLLDSSVLFSLDDGNVLDILWELHLSLYTTDLILAEWETVDTDSLIQSGLIAISLSNDAIAEIFRISPQYRNIKPSDLSLFLHASDNRDCIVITGDKRLRALCEGSGIPVHGVLWILDLIHDRGLLSRPDLIQALRAMIEKGNYLPESDCQERVDRWESDK